MIETRPPTAGDRHILDLVLEVLRPDVAAVLCLGVEEGEVFATWLLEGGGARCELRLWIKLPGLGSFPLVQVPAGEKVEALGYEWNDALELRRAVVDALRAVGLRPRTQWLTEDPPGDSSERPKLWELRPAEVRLPQDPPLPPSWRPRRLR